MYRVRSGGWVWYFLEVADWNRLGPRPDNHTGNTETVKINRVRGVFRRDGYYLKTEMPRCTGSFSIWREILFPRARREFWRLWRLQRLGIPVTEPVGFGQSAFFSMLITREWAGGIPAGDYFHRVCRRDPERRAAFLRQWCAFYRRLQQVPVYHADFHNGNILYRPESGEFALVDAMAVRRRMFWDRFRPVGMARILAEFRSVLSKAEFCGLIRDCGVTAEPEAFYARLWQHAADFARREWKKRRRQFLGGYPKFVQKKDGVIYPLDAARDPLVQPEDLASLEKKVMEPQQAEAYLVEDFRLFLLGIPAIRAAACADDGTLYLEPVSGAAGPAEKSELQEILRLTGMNPADFDYVIHADGRPCVRRK